MRSVSRGASALCIRFVSAGAFARHHSVTQFRAWAFTGHHPLHHGLLQLQHIRGTLCIVLYLSAASHRGGCLGIVFRSVHSAQLL